MGLAMTVVDMEGKRWNPWSPPPHVVSGRVTREAQPRIWWLFVAVFFVAAVILGGSAFLGCGS